MGRTADIRRHFRERAIARRFEVASYHGLYPDVLDGQNGRLHKEPFVWPFNGPWPRRGNYLARGVCRRGWDDEEPNANVRQALKRDTLRQLGEVA